MTSQSPSTFFFFCYSWFYKALSYFCPAESFPGMRAPGTQLLHVCQLLHILLVLLPLPVPLPAALYLFWRQGTHLPIGFTMQHGFTLGKSSVLFFLCHFSLPNNSFNFICHFNCYWAVSWCFPSSYISYSFHTFPACHFSSDGGHLRKSWFYILGVFSPHFWRTIHPWLFLNLPHATFIWYSLFLALEKSEEWVDLKNYVQGIKLSFYSIILFNKQVKLMHSTMIWWSNCK